MVFNPCPCMNLQKGSMVLAIVDAVISMLNLGLLILALVIYINDDDDLELSHSERTAGLIVVGFLILICVLQILLAYRLYNGSRSKNYRQCRIWLIITAVITGLNIASFILNFTASDFNGSSFGSTLINILYKIYEMWVVHAFLRELQFELEMNVSYAVAAQPQPPPLNQMYYTSEGAAQIYVTPQTQQSAYPMQQFSPPPPYPTTNNGAYPTPVLHVTTTTIS